MELLKGQIIHLLKEIEKQQKEKLLKMGREFVPTLTEEDVLQPIDYPELEENPYFRYEEGILAGIYIAQTALTTLLAEHEVNTDY